ncbi:MAG TPA: glycogen synthase [Bacilli bacterium]|nr:glycogen synthase [Bacilli bacterium]
MKILMVASEGVPFSKTGGLADVIYSLSKEEVALGHEVSIVLPLYGRKLVGEYELKLVATVSVPLGWRQQVARIYTTVVEGITYYLVENEYYFGRDGIYGYYDDMERFAFFTIAVRNMMAELELKFDLIHVHDWQAGMLPVVIKEQNKREKLFNKIKFVLTIHNPAFQGMFDPNLIVDFYNLPMALYESGQVRFRDRASTLKAAIMYCDKITTVSPTHAQELLTREGSKGLDDILVLRANDFSGIVNGIDNIEFDPAHDLHISKTYSVKTLKNKQANKIAIAKDLGLKNPAAPLFGIVTRLTWQKGIDLFIAGAKEALEHGANVIALGSGEYGLEQALERLRSEFPEQMAVYIGYNNKLAHNIYAASDFFMMPSLFEPCGIGQLIAMRYGSLPIVRRTGGLKDTVNIYNGHNLAEATGYGFDEYDEYWMKLTVNFALENYKHEEIHNQLVVNAMKYDVSWKKSAKLYLSLFKTIK